MQVSNRASLHEKSVENVSHAVYTLRNQHRPIPLVKTVVIISLSLPAGVNNCIPLVSFHFLLHCYLCFFLFSISCLLLLRPPSSLAPLSLYHAAPRPAEKS